MNNKFVKDAIDGLRETMPQLAAKIENLPWIDDGVDSFAELQAARGLISLADAGHTAKLVEEPWVVEGRNYPALESLWILLTSYPEDFARVMTHPTVSDGITGQEAKIVATLADVDLLDRLLDAAQVTVEERNIILPLAGETELAIIRTKPGADHTMDLLEHSVRSIEEFMGLPFPRRQVIYVFVDDPEAEAGAANFDTHVRVFVNEQSYQRRDLFNMLAHEAGHYYWSTYTPWLHEGAAVFLESVADNSLHDGMKQEPCDSAQTIAELEAGYSILGPAPVEHCAYALGELLFRDLYRNMDDRTFRLGFRRLYLHTKWRVPGGCDNLDATLDRTTICHVREAFTAYASEDVKAKVEKVTTRRYGGTADLPDASIRGVVSPGPDGWHLGRTASLWFQGKPNDLWADLPRDGTFDVLVPSGSHIIEVHVWVDSEDPSVGYTNRLLGWYDGSGGVTTDPSQAFEVLVGGADVEGIEIMLPADINSLLCPTGTWRSRSDGQCE